MNYIIKGSTSPSPKAEQNTYNPIVNYDEFKEEVDLNYEYL